MSSLHASPLHSDSFLLPFEEDEYQQTLQQNEIVGFLRAQIRHIDTSGNLEIATALRIELATRLAASDAFAEASVEAAHAVVLGRRAFAPAALGRMLFTLADLHLSFPDPSPALPFIDESIALAQAASDSTAAAARLSLKGALLGRLGRWQESLPLFAEGLSLLRANGESLEKEGLMYAGMAEAHRELGAHDEELRCYREAGACYLRGGDPEAAAGAYFAAGQTADSLGQSDEAIAAFEAGLAAARRVFLENPEPMRVLLLQLGRALGGAGRPAEARPLLEECLPLIEEELPAQAAPLLPTVLHALAQVLHQLGEWTAAEAHLLRALHLGEKRGDLHVQARVLSELGVNAMERDRPQDAAARFAAALHMLVQQGDAVGEVTALCNLGAAHMGCNQVKEAIEVMQRGLQRVDTLDDPETKMRLQLNLGQAYLRSGELTLARALYEEVLPRARQSLNKDLLAAVLGEAAEVYAGLGIFRRAIELQRQVLDHANETAQLRLQIHALERLATCYFYLPDPPLARKYNEWALLKARDLGDRYLEAGALYNLGVWEAEHGSGVPRGVELVTQAREIYREEAAARGVEKADEVLLTWRERELS